MPADPSGIEQPHDVLAAEEFALPTRDQGGIPPDPIHEPHDVLAAEEFAIPTSGGTQGGKGGLQPRTLLPGLALTAVLLALVKLVRR